MKLLFAKPRNGWINVNRLKLIQYRMFEEPMLYAVFLFWVVASISVVVASLVLGGLLCVWCAFIGRRRFQRDVAALLVHRLPSPSPALSQ
jgi:membrane protein required for beta-lactamase induction